MDNHKRRQAVEAFIQQDPYANSLGAKIEILAPGHSRVTLKVTETMANFHGMTHGAIIFTVSDIAFSVAGNSRGQTAVALNVDISFLRASQPGDPSISRGRRGLRPSGYG